MDRVRNLLCIDEIYKKGITGRGVGVAILDTGISNHLDLMDNIECFVDFVGNSKINYDDNGHGTHVSGIIAGTGAGSHGLYRGIAPGARLIMLKCLDGKGNGSISDSIRAFDFIVNNKDKLNIKIVNISLGTSNEKNKKDISRLILEVENLWKEGITVVAAAGNNGPASNSITAPGSAEKIITVGACDDKYFPGNAKKRDYSGRGCKKRNIIKPEIVCPGTNIMSCDLRKNGYTRRSGTSMSAPIVAGIVALVLEMFPDMTNDEVKNLICSTAKDVGLSKEHQGFGMVNPKKIIST